MTTTATAIAEDQTPVVADTSDDIIRFSTTHDKDGNALTADQQPAATPDATPATPAAASAGEGTEGDATTTAGAEEHDEDDQRKPDESPQQFAARTRSKLQKRIDKLTADRYTEKGRADAAEAELTRLRTKLETTPSKATSGADPDDTNAGTADPDPFAAAFEREHPKPKSNDFADYDDFTDALTDWKSDRKDFIREQAAEATRVADQTRARDGRVRANVQTFAAKTPDYDAVMANAPNVNVPPHAHAALLESEHGAAIAYSLVKNPTQAKALHQMSPTEQIKWVGRQELAHEKAAGAPPRTPKPITAAPDPLDTEGAVASHRRSDDELTTDERIEKWEREEAAAKRRR